MKPVADRIVRGRRRARLAKATVGAVALGVFGACTLLARINYAGHAKQPIDSLSIPQPLYEVVRRNLLQGGVLAPATAPPDAATSTS
ncbi:MAG: hypothetical protein ACJ77E_04630 [Gaiellaceae bacterium]